MHDHHDHHDHAHEHHHTHTHEHTHDGVTHTHAHDHAHVHEHGHPHEHDHLHGADHAHHHHHHDHECTGDCGGCGSQCQHTPMEELMALMKYMASHNTAHANELAALARQLQQAGNSMAYEQVMAAVSDYEKGNMRLQAVLASMEVK